MTKKKSLELADELIGILMDILNDLDSGATTAQVRVWVLEAKDQLPAILEGLINDNA